VLQATDVEDTTEHLDDEDTHTTTQETLLQQEVGNACANDADTDVDTDDNDQQSPDCETPAVQTNIEQSRTAEADMTKGPQGDVLDTDTETDEEDLEPPSQTDNWGDIGRWLPRPWKARKHDLVVIGVNSRGKFDSKSPPHRGQHAARLIEHGKAHVFMVAETGIRSARMAQRQLELRTLTGGGTAIMNCPSPAATKQLGYSSSSSTLMLLAPGMKITEHSLLNSGRLLTVATVDAAGDKRRFTVLHDVPGADSTTQHVIDELCSSVKRVKASAQARGEQHVLFGDFNFALLPAHRETNTLNQTDKRCLILHQTIVQDTPDAAAMHRLEPHTGAQAHYTHQSCSSATIDAFHVDASLAAVDLQQTVAEHPGNLLSQDHCPLVLVLPGNPPADQPPAPFELETDDLLRWNLNERQTTAYTKVLSTPSATTTMTHLHATLKSCLEVPLLGGTTMPLEQLHLAATVLQLTNPTLTAETARAVPELLTTTPTRRQRNC